ncbi:MAG: hydrogenase maturation nickel metallochaperone HypA [Candidatus Krumholzibacteriota bacterium]|nr:hydrogenase maturation nickel metallochaperone HypA [Candidatus Krumholzibacteriota bacterium]
MHEVSLMQNLLNVVSEAAKEQGDGKVTSIHLKIGRMAGVNSDSLRFAFDILSKGTRADSAVLEIEMIPLKIHCNGCSEDISPEEFSLYCSLCGSRDMTIVSGREMEIDYIMVEDSDGISAGNSAARE